jgi:hypothetical protein
LDLNFIFEYQLIERIFVGIPNWLIIYCFTSHSKKFHLWTSIFEPMLGAQSFWAGRDLHRATPAVKGGLFFRSHPMGRPIKSPITTRKGMKRTYYNPEPRGSMEGRFTFNLWKKLKYQVLTNWFKTRKDWLIDYLRFSSRPRIFHLYGDVTIAGEGLQNLGLCSALRAFEQGGILIVPDLLWHVTSVFPVSSEGPPQLVGSYDRLGDVEDLF